LIKNTLRLMSNKRFYSKRSKNIIRFDDLPIDIIYEIITKMNL
jgi:hypothetical protein